MSGAGAPGSRLGNWTRGRQVTADEHCRGLHSDTTMLYRILTDDGQICGLGVETFDTNGTLLYQPTTYVAGDAKNGVGVSRWSEQVQR